MLLCKATFGAVTVVGTVYSIDIFNSLVGCHVNNIYLNNRLMGA